MDEYTIYAPLTKAEFDEGCYDTFDGVAVTENEDGGSIYAYGHVDPPRMIEAIRAFGKDVGVDEYEEFTEADVRHVWAQTIAPPDGPDGWRFVYCAADADQAWPVTVVEE